MGWVECTTAGEGSTTGWVEVTSGGVGCTTGWVGKASSGEGWGAKHTRSSTTSWVVKCC